MNLEQYNYPGVSFNVNKMKGKNEKLERGWNAEVFRETLTVNLPHLFTLRYSESLVRITLKEKHLELNA